MVYKNIFFKFVIKRVNMFLPEDIDLSNVEKYTLAVRLKPNGFAFFIQDIENKNCSTYQETVFSNEDSLLKNIQRIIFDYNFLTDSFKRVSVIVVSSDYELIPNEFYDKKSTKEIYNFTHSNKSECVLTCGHPLQECRTIFGMNEDVYLFLMRSLYNPVFYHHGSFTIDYFRSKITKEKSNALFINFHDYFVDIICFNKNNKAVYSHTYQKEQEQNLLYYTLNVWEKSNFDQHSDALYIYGYPLNTSIQVTLKKYIKEIRSIGVFDQISDFGEKAQTVPLDILKLQASLSLS